MEGNDWQKGEGRGERSGCWTDGEEAAWLGFQRQRHAFYFLFKSHTSSPFAQIGPVPSPIFCWCVVSGFGDKCRFLPFLFGGGKRKGVLDGLLIVRGDEEKKGGRLSSSLALPFCVLHSSFFFSRPTHTTLGLAFLFLQSSIREEKRETRVEGGGKKNQDEGGGKIRTNNKRDVGQNGTHAHTQTDTRTHNMHTILTHSRLWLSPSDLICTPARPRLLSERPLLDFRSRTQTSSYYTGGHSRLVHNTSSPMETTTTFPGFPLCP